jgi:hypothetical protein
MTPESGNSKTKPKNKSKHYPELTQQKSTVYTTNSFTNYNPNLKPIHKSHKPQLKYLFQIFSKISSKPIKAGLIAKGTEI